MTWVCSRLLLLTGLKSQYMTHVAQHILCDITLDFSPVAWCSMGVVGCDRSNPDTPNFWKWKI